MILYKKYQLKIGSGKRQEQMVRPSRSKRNPQHRSPGQAHVRPQHPLLARRDPRRADRHGGVHQRADSRRQEREAGRPGHLFVRHRLPDHGAESAETFKIGTHVKGVRLRARATGELRQTARTWKPPCANKACTTWPPPAAAPTPVKNPEAAACWANPAPLSVYRIHPFKNPNL